MAKLYSDDIVFKAFALVMDGLSAQKASELLREHCAGSDGKAPGKRTIEDWARKGENTKGVSWYNIRDLASAVRMNNDVSQVIRESKKSHETWLEHTYSDIDALQDIMMANLSQMSFSVSDLKTLAQTRVALDQASGQRYEETRDMTLMIGKIVNRAFVNSAALYPANKTIINVLEATMQEIQEEFTTYVSLGCPIDYEPGSATKSSGRRLHSGNEVTG